jgi:hypothetical protein
MNSQILIILFAVLSAVALLMLASRLKIFREPEMATSILKMALYDRESATIGVGFALFYALIFLIFGGRGGRIHILYGRWIFNMTIADAILGCVVMLLVALAMMLFAYNIKIMGLPKADKGGLGLLGAALALLASFCP